MNEFHEHFRHIATEFLRTAVVLDDRAYGGSGASGGVLQRPPTRRSYRPDDGKIADSSESSHDLNSARLVEGFARHGILCGVLDCRPGTREPDKVVEHADIVVLDWQMWGDGGESALERIRRLAVARHQLRIVAVYTGEPKLDAIRERIRGTEVANGRRWDGLPSGMLQCNNCYVALYCKEDANPRPSLADRVVHEGNLAGRVVADFVEIAAGLVPAVALTALTSVRDNAYRLLSSFAGGLDPAFLCHRACLETPDDAETLVARMMAGEIEEVIGDAVAARQPAGFRAISAWLETRDLNDQTRSELRRLLAPGGDRTAQLVSPELRGSKPKKPHRWFTGKLTGDTAPDVDLEFAWLASHRIVIGDQARRLHLGTVVGREHCGAQELYVCIRPRCDSVRLRGDTPFLFLTLTDGKGVATMVLRNSTGLVLKTVSNIPFVHNFTPRGEDGVVMSRACGPKGHCFVDSAGAEFEWLGELREEFAQRIVQRYGSHLGRVAAEDTEWLRMTERDR